MPAAEGSAITIDNFSSKDYGFVFLTSSPGGCMTARQVSPTQSLLSNPISILLVLIAALLTPALAAAGEVHPLFNLQSPAQSPFPSDRFTVFDFAQNTALRVNLPLPNCATNPSDCMDTLLLNQLDGFNPQPRISIPFDGAIDVSTVNSQTVFLVRIGNVLDADDAPLHPIGINQVVWDPATLTLHVESDEHLDQHSNYLLLVTTGIRDASGKAIEASESFEQLGRDDDDDFDFARGQDRQARLYRQILARLVRPDVLRQIEAGLGRKLRRKDIAVASLFTTESVTATLEKIRDQIKAAPAPVASFNLGLQGERTVFPLNALHAILFQQEVGTAPAFNTVPVPTPALAIVPSVAAVAFGKFRALNFEAPGAFIPAVPTRTGVPAVQSTADLYFNVFIPAGPRPARGWPVAIFSHGFGDNKNNSPFAVAAVMAAAGVATITVNSVGHGFGPLSTLTVVLQNGNLVILPAGGRGVDLNGDGKIDPTEGFLSPPPHSSSATRDGVQQTVADLMQLVRAIQGGMDVDGSGSAALDPSRIYFFGQSLGGICGTVFLGIEPDVRAGVVNVPGGSFGEISRLSPTFRPLAGFLLAIRVPSLINVGGLAFNENEPLRNQPPVTNNVPGAMAIQTFFDNTEWMSQAGDPVAWAPFIRKSPLAGEHQKPVIVQFARGDETVPNPATTALLRSGGLADRATFFRNDIAFSLGVGFPKNPHAFLTNLAAPLPVAGTAIEAQKQIAVFFASDGALTIDPDGPAPLFETPIVPPLPEDLAFIP
jgi:hypothetical protein